MFCRGVGLEKRMLPFVPGFEIIGTVQTLGEAARARGIFKEGQRVAGLSLNGGGNSRFISVPGDRLFHISPTVKSTNAVCLIHDYMAALKALRLAKKAGSPFTGMKMLVTDGFSPVGQAIIALANMEGASIYCCADIANHAYLTSMGAKCFEKAPDSWLPSVSGTFDVVIDNSCVDSYSSSWFALNQRGTLVCLSPVFEFDRPRDAGCGIIDFGELQKKWAGVKAKYIMPHTHFFDTLRDYDTDREQYLQDMKYLTFLLEKGDITPKIAEKVALEDVPDAQRLMHSGKANGTIVCVPWIEN
jgi:NADPH2:quinone reductase